ncbi:hybrid sensor histidine kinase/response regulator [Nitrospirillum sp. BR 11163]|uniref:hybrid sensor histidine kinase/response regulator n=1 Tax=Nitrospirillum sp. BR 11163 TaxID=3104323 RepID=UPI002AFE3431|nr:hybrid sensor histidine kinase/response regulator [Nitrospirillum sp. BR 11163]MEA1673943.1 hybrid sensor histidine kinase/response regulator [Nitrospirillum sp. BR 11163]
MPLEAVPARRAPGPAAPSLPVTFPPVTFNGPVGDLVDLVQALSFCRDVPSVMVVVRMAARALSGADGVTFVLRDGDLCHYADEDAIGPLWKGRRFPLSTCISGWVMLNRRPAVIPDIYRDDRIPHDAYRPTFVKSLVMVPVRTDEPVAAIGAYWATAREPKAEEVALLQAVAHSTAVALTNVQLYESLRAALAESQARAEEAEKANRAKSVFLAAISHDLRQPLQTMRLYHNMLSERAANGRATVATTAAGGGAVSSAAPGNGLANALDRKLIGGMGEALSAGEELLRALLDVSVLDAGMVTVNPQRFGLEAAMAGLVSAIRGDAEKAGVDIRLRPGAKTGPQAALEEADTDPVLLKCILRNLLSNAVRYTGRGGRVLVSTRRRGRSMLVQVWDTGMGIASDQLDTVFEDFVQLNNPERDRTKGLGLGLGIVRRMARLLGTSVTVRSTLGRGSVFSILVPCVPAAPAVAVAPVAKDGPLPFPRDGQRPAQRESDPRTILAVEDDALQRMALGAIIESWGYRVITAAGSDDALATIRDAVRLPGLVISDFRLPGPLNGVQLVARLGNEVRRHLPGIIVTGDTDPARIQEASATGCALIHKPYLPEVLRAAIEEVLRGLEDGGNGEAGALDA